MTVTEAAVAAVLTAEWSAVEIKNLRPLHGGQWATMAHVRIAGGPGAVDDIVVRVVPDPALGAKELAVQAAAAAAGIRTPRIHLTGEAGGPLRGAWAVMDFAAGTPLLSGLDGIAAIRQLPTLLRDLPRQLAQTMAAIHRLDPDPVAQCVRRATPGVALTVDELWGHLRAAADGVPALQQAVERLRDRQPSRDAAVLCHGDLHPFNLLTASDGTITVLDWTGAAVAPPAFDVAFTWLLLRDPPLEAPLALRPVIRAGGRALARRFLHAYRTANPSASLDHLDWYTALHATRVLLELAQWTRSGDDRARTHPWRHVAPGAREAIRRVGVDVSDLGGLGDVCVSRTRRGGGPTPSAME